MVDNPKVGEYYWILVPSGCEYSYPSIEKLELSEIAHTFRNKYVFKPESLVCYLYCLKNEIFPTELEALNHLKKMIKRDYNHWQDLANKCREQLLSVNNKIFSAIRA